jgi:hypothetical protein
MLWKSGIGMAVFYEGLVSYNVIRVPTCRRHVPKGKAAKQLQRH